MVRQVMAQVGLFQHLQRAQTHLNLTYTPDVL